MSKIEKWKKKLTKQNKRILAWGGMAAVVLLLAVMPMMAAGNDTDADDHASILSGTAEVRSVDTQIIGGGQLSSEAAIRLKIPEEVKLTQYLVGNGDTVSEGDPIAKVDKISVMTAITGVQDTLDYLSDEITSVSDDTASSYVKAHAGGTVKVIYAQEGENVQDVMLDHGALAVLSLDDTMAVQIQRNTELQTGDTVCVRFSSGEEVDGRVKSNLDGVLTITVEDEDYAVGTQVTVESEDGDRIGTGTLYIYSPWNATAYSGTVKDILIEEGDTVSVGRSLIQLDDPGHTAEYQRLIDQRQEYEELMQELFQMYRTETITAPCDGIVTDVDEDGAYLLSDEGENWFVDLLTFFGKEETGFVAYAAAVQSVTDSGMELLMAPEMQYVNSMEELTCVAADTDEMTEIWNYSGDTTVHIQSDDGLLHADGTAKPGDILLAVGDEEAVHWFVRMDNTKKQETSSESTIRTILLSNNAGGEKTEEKEPIEASLHISNTQGTAKETFSATLSAIDKNGNALSGTWSIESGTFSMALYGEMIYGTPQTAGEHTVTVLFVPNDSEESFTATFTLNIAEPYEIITSALPEGKVGEAYQFTMQVSGSTAGKWGYENLPAGLVLNQETGEISGEPVMTGSFDVTITYTDENKGILTKAYQMKISGSQKPEEEGGFPGGDMSGGMGDMSGGNMPSGGMSGGMTGGAITGGFVQEEDDNLYSLEKLTIASVTSQEHMTVEVTIDELDISEIYVGQAATITMDALAGETFEAKVSKIAGSGENDGGNSKFTVELTLEKSGDMLPGMTASAYITLSTTENVLCVPASAVSEENGETVLYTSYDEESGTLSGPVSVTVGVADADYVQILDGLQEDTIFYYAYYDTLTDSGMPQPGGMPMGDR